MMDLLKNISDSIDEYSGIIRVLGLISIIPLTFKGRQWLKKNCRAKLTCDTDKVGLARYEIIITNEHKARAENIRFEFIAVGENVTQGEVLNKFPYDVIDGERTLKLPFASFAVAGKTDSRKLKFALTWDEKFKKNNTQIYNLEF